MSQNGGVIISAFPPVLACLELLRCQGSRKLMAFYQQWHKSHLLGSASAEVTFLQTPSPVGLNKVFLQELRDCQGKMNCWSWRKMCSTLIWLLHSYWNGWGGGWRKWIACTEVFMGQDKLWLAHFVLGKNCVFSMFLKCPRPCTQERWLGWGIPLRGSAWRMDGTRGPKSRFPVEQIPSCTGKFASICDSSKDEIVDAVVLLLQASGCCMTAAAPLSPSGCSELVTFKMKFWTLTSNFSTFTQRASTEVHESLSVVGSPLQVLGEPLLVLRFTPWQGWPVSVLSLAESLGGGNREQNCFPEGTEGPRNQDWILTDLFSGSMTGLLGDLGEVPSSFCASVSLAFLFCFSLTSQTCWQLAEILRDICAEESWNWNVLFLIDSGDYQMKKSGWMGFWETWSSGKCPCLLHGIGLDGLQSPFQPKPPFCDYVILW